MPPPGVKKVALPSTEFISPEVGRCVSSVARLQASNNLRNFRRGVQSAQVIERPSALIVVAAPRRQGRVR